VGGGGGGGEGEGGGGGGTGRHGYLSGGREMKAPGVGRELIAVNQW